VVVAVLEVLEQELDYLLPQAQPTLLLLVLVVQGALQALLVLMEQVVEIHLLLALLLLKTHQGQGLIR
jgi:hypothetical protein